MAEFDLRCLTWNISAGVLEKEDGAAEAGEYVARCIAGFHPDVVALQEVPFFEPENEFIEEVARKAGFVHSYYFAVSPSHLHENARLGIAVLSRFPLAEARRVDLPNPNLIIDLPDGRREKTHDKAMIVARILHPGCEFWFICAHLPPFPEFNRRPGEPMFWELRSVMRETFRSVAGQPVVFAGDINAESMRQLAPELLESDGYSELIYRPTKTDGDVRDQIACSRHWKDGSALVVPSRSDHSICVGDVSFGNPRHSGVHMEPISGSQVNILHLSDLHFGPGTQEDVDWKQYLEEADRDTRSRQFERRLRSLPVTPDYVVISGDFTVGGRSEGFQACRELLNNLIEEGVLPPADRILVAPGNHDVTHSLQGRPARGEERWTAFKSELAENFVRPWMPGDPPAANVVQAFRKELDPGKAIWGGVRVEQNERTKKPSFIHFPVLFDRHRKVLFYLFNSASVSGTRIRLDEKTAKVIEASQTLRLQDAEAINTLIAEINRLREVDAARVSPEEIYLFQDIMGEIRKAAPEALQQATKIVVLHHHIAPIYTEEVKQFELLLNAGQFKKAIVSEDFSLVLHGHKHWPHIFADTTVTGSSGRGLCVISGGTVGGWSAKTPGFYWIELRQDATSAAAYLSIAEGNPAGSLEDVPKIDVGLKRKMRHTANTHVDLRSLYDDCERSMMSLIRRQEVWVEGKAYENVGWNNFLGATNVTPFGTAYALRVMKFLNADSPEYRKVRQQVCETMLRMRRKNLGWSASSLGEPGQPIETALVLSAMSRIIPEHELQEGVEHLIAQLEQTDCRAFLDSTIGVSMIAQALAELAPQTPQLQRLVGVLLDGCRTDQRGRYLCWHRRTFARPDRAADADSGEPSVPHTAHAMATLRQVHRKTGGRLGLAESALNAAAEWLLQAEWRNSAEAVEECDGKRLTINYYTAPMAVLALLLCEYSPSTQKIAATVEELWRANERGLWWYEQVRWPVWATLSCLEALTEFTFRSSPMYE